MSADIAWNPPPVPSPATATRAALRLRVDGLGAGERASLGAILDVLAGKLPRPWVVVDGDDADVYAHTRGARRGSVRAAVTALLVREDEPQGSPGELWMPVPMRVMAVLDLLQVAQDRLPPARDMRGQDAAPEPAAAPGVNDEKTLASSLARLFVRAFDHSMRVRMLGYGTLYVCPQGDSYRTDFEVDRIGQALEAKRFILTAIAPDSSELAATDAQAHPLDELLWAIGLMTPSERHPGPLPRQRLRSWPDFARLSHEPAHLRACAALSTAPMDLHELAGATGLDEVQADRFLHACALCGLLETVADAAPPPPRATAASLGGLFDRLRRRLVK